jgi:hypothetical protein
VCTSECIKNLHRINAHCCILTAFQKLSLFVVVFDFYIVHTIVCSELVFLLHFYNTQNVWNSVARSSAVEVHEPREQPLPTYEIAPAGQQPIPDEFVKTRNKVSFLKRCLTCLCVRWPIFK